MKSEDGHAGQKAWVVALLIVSALAFAMFADVLLSSKPTCLSKVGTDLSHQFLAWREFGFREIGQGRIPLWNPHVFSGAPYFGEFQSALLYPPNAVFLFLPVWRAVNWSIWLHVVLLGFFMYLWAVRRGLSFYACLLSAFTIMFCGPFFLHIYAGHLPNICAMAWAPLIFLSLDGWFEQRSCGWLFLGILAVTMQILAGHPQYVYYTAVAAGIFSLANLVHAHRRIRAAVGVAAIYLGASALAAVQMLPGIEATLEGVRGFSAPQRFTAFFSFPPENLITLLSPGVLGDMSQLPYWGRWYLWEMSLFMGIAGLGLAVLGAFASSRRTRRYSVTMVLICFTLALGSYAPFHRILSTLTSGFHVFRGSSKFIFPAALFAALLAGIGWDRLRASAPLQRSAKAALAGIVLVLIALTAGAFILTQPSAGNLRESIVRLPLESGESLLSPDTYDNPAFLKKAGREAARSLGIALALAIAVVLLFWASRRFRSASAIVWLAAVVEIFLFARGYRPTFSYPTESEAKIAAFLRQRPGDYRIWNVTNPNSALTTGAFDLWGADPSVLRRYAQFVAFSQGKNPDQATQDIFFRSIHPWLKILRCRFIIEETQSGLQFQEINGWLPRLQLVSRWKVLTDREAIFSQMALTDFDPTQTVILEKAPDPAPSPSTAEAGSCRVVESGTDFLVIEAILKSPAILLVTDSFSRGWRAELLSGGSQLSYDLMPADYALMALPLNAGRHVVRLRFRPRTLTSGIVISAASAGILLIGIGIWKRNVRRRKKLPTTEPETRPDR